MESYIEYIKDNNISNNLHTIVMKTREHPILEEYLKLYLQTDKGKKELDLKDDVGETALMLSSGMSKRYSTIGTIKL